MAVVPGNYERLTGVVAVVGPQFCAPHAVPLTVTKKALSLTGGNFVVTDTNGTILLKVKGIYFAFRERRILLDAAGNSLLSMQAKIVTWHDRWRVFRGESIEMKDLLFTVKRSAVIQFKPELDVYLAANTEEQICDFKIKGSYFERSVTIYIGGTDTVIAQLSRKYTVANVLLGKDTFEVTIYPNVDYVFIAALVVILDEIEQSGNN